MPRRDLLQVIAQSSSTPKQPVFELNQRTGERNQAQRPRSSVQDGGRLAPTNLSVVENAKFKRQLRWLCFRHPHEAPCNWLMIDDSCLMLSLGCNDDDYLEIAHVIELQGRRLFCYLVHVTAFTSNSCEHNSMFRSRTLKSSNKQACPKIVSTTAVTTFCILQQTKVLFSSPALHV